MKFFGRSTRREDRPKNRSRATRGLVPRVGALEDRALMTILGVWANATPQKLPSNGKYTAVRLTGEVTTSRMNEIPIVTCQVVDQYAYAQGTRSVKLTKVKDGDFKFDFTIRLLARHSSTFASGRLYSIAFGYQDSDNGAGKTVPVLVPNPKG